MPIVRQRRAPLDSEAHANPGQRPPSQPTPAAGAKPPKTRDDAAQNACEKVKKKVEAAKPLRPGAP